MLIIPQAMAKKKSREWSAVSNAADREIKWHTRSDSRGHLWHWEGKVVLGGWKPDGEDSRVEEEKWDTHRELFQRAWLWQVCLTVLRWEK